MADDDVVVPKEVERRIRAIHPPEAHDDELESAKTYYRVLREDRRAELRATKQPTQFDPPEQQPTSAQSEKMLAKKRRKVPRKRKIRVYPQQGSAQTASPSTYEQGMWDRYQRNKAYADARDAAKAVAVDKADEKRKGGHALQVPVPVKTLKHISDKQPRTEKRLKALEDEVRTSGRIDPVAVQIIRGKPHLMNGHHRVEVAERMGRKTVPARIRLGAYRADKDPHSPYFSKAAEPKFHSEQFPELYANTPEAREKRKKIVAEGGYIENQNWVKEEKEKRIRAVQHEKERLAFPIPKEGPPWHTPEQRRDEAYRKHRHRLDNPDEYAAKEAAKQAKDKLHAETIAGMDAKAVADKARIAANNAKAKKLKAAGKWKEPPSLSMNGRKHTHINSPWQNAKGEMLAKAKDRRVLVTGSRHWADEPAVHSRLDKVGRRKRLTVIEGGAKGADASAASWAKRTGSAHEPYKADWKAHGRAAGPIRNKRMLTEGRPDIVLAFHEDAGKSKGTKNMLMEAKKAGVPAVLYGSGGKPVRRREMRRMGLSKSMRLADKSIVRFRVKKNPPVPEWATDDYSRQYLDRTKMTARRKGKTVGEMDLYPRGVGDPVIHGAMHHPPGTVAYIETGQAHRGKGIATGMWHHAKKHGLKPLHSTAQTPAGKAWADKVGKSMRLPDKSIVRFRTYKRGPGDFNTVEAMRKQKNIGYLELQNVPDMPIVHGLVHHVKTKKKYRRKGIGTGMWNQAKKQGLEPQHNYDNLSSSGKPWAEAVGKADYAAELRMEAENRRSNARWAQQHPEWVEQHKRLALKTEADKKAERSAGRKRVSEEKMLVPIRADKGTVPSQKLRHRLFRRGKKALQQSHAA